MWKLLGRLGPASSTQNRTRSPTRATKGSWSYWLAMPLNTTNVGVSALTASASTSAAAAGAAGATAVAATNTSDCTSTYSRSTGGSPSGGSMMTAPCMPAAMWALMGIVEQWYIHTPARPAVNR